MTVSVVRKVHSGPTILRVLAVAMIVAGCLVAIFMKTGEVDLVPCSIFTEFTPCGHRTDYRIPLRIGILAIGILSAMALFRFARRLDDRQRELQPRAIGGSDSVTETRHDL
jgi:hypothetical protein